MQDAFFLGRLLHFACSFCMPCRPGPSFGYPRPPKRLVLNSSALFRRGFLSLQPHFNIVVGLKLRNQSSLVQFVQAANDSASPFFGSTLTVDQFVPPMRQRRRKSLRRQLPDGKRIQQYSSRAEQSHGYADGTPVQVQSAFNTLLGSFQQNGQTVYANLSDAQVPSALSGTVAAVLGLPTRARCRRPSTHSPQPLHPCPPYTSTRSEFWTAYDVASTPTGGATTIAIFAEGDLTQVIKDLRVSGDRQPIAAGTGANCASRFGEHRHGWEAKRSDTKSKERVPASRVCAQIYEHQSHVGIDVNKVVRTMSRLRQFPPFVRSVSRSLSSQPCRCSPTDLHNLHRYLRQLVDGLRYAQVFDYLREISFGKDCNCGCSAVGVLATS